MHKTNNDFGAESLRDSKTKISQKWSDRSYGLSMLLAIITIIVLLCSMTVSYSWFKNKNCSGIEGDHKREACETNQALKSIVWPITIPMELIVDYSDKLFQNIEVVEKTNDKI